MSESPAYRREIALARWALAGFASGVAAMGLYGAIVGRRRLELTRPTIHVRGLPQDLEGFRIALLTDMHAGRMTPLSVIRRAVDRTLEEQPHLIALTGDFADRATHDITRALRALEGLWAPMGVYAVPGNHDHVFGGIRVWRREIAAHPCIQDLTNRSVLLEVGEARLCIAGVDDLEEGAPWMDLPPAGQRDLTILLAHNPDHGERTRRAIDEVDLVLSGHTHAGQIRVPRVGALKRKSEIYDEGLLRRPWTQVYTSRGIGTTFLPFRLGARPEVALLTLTGMPRDVR